MARQAADLANGVRREVELPVVGGMTAQAAWGSGDFIDSVGIHIVELNLFAKPA